MYLLYQGKNIGHWITMVPPCIILKLVYVSLVLHSEVKQYTKSRFFHPTNTIFVALPFTKLHIYTHCFNPHPLIYLKSSYLLSLVNPFGMLILIHIYVSKRNISYISFNISIGLYNLSMHIVQ